MTDLTAVSLFAGVGGFDIAMNRQGIRTVATVEIDRNARGVLERQFPEASHFSDITEVTSEQLRDAGFVPDRGIITGGFPCQDLSVAGKRAGLAGGRSGLFWEIVRLGDELRPRWLVLENVPGLLSSNDGRDFGIVIGALVELGYGVAWGVLDAQFFGVPQRRRRVFIVGRLGNDGRAPSEVLALPQSLRGDFEARDEARPDVANAVTGRLGSGGPDDNTAQGGHLVIANPVGLKRRNDLEMETYVVQPTLLRAVSHGEYVADEVTSTLHQRDHKGGTIDVVVAPAVAVKTRRAQSDQDNETWVEGGVSPTLNAMDNTGDSRATVLIFDTGSHGDGIRVSDDSTPTLNGRMGTGGNNTPMVLAFSHNNTDIATPNPETASALKAQHQAGGAAVMIEGPSAVVRRLTPRECERLQGFPDDWTENRLINGALVKQADSSRYKQMGNAVAVPVVSWIMERLVAQDEALG